MKRIFITDCEGPISKNDNAFELATHFIPQGDKLFTNISKYDDVLADVLRKPSYSAGGTLKLILPFFKAYGITDKQTETFSKKNIILIPNSENALHYIQSIAESFIVSTSYEHYIKALCEALNFPFENTYCTKVSLDEYVISPKEKKLLKQLSTEIAKMPLIKIPAGAKTLADFSRIDQESIDRLDKIFWTEIPTMGISKILGNVVTVGGEQKAASIKDAIKRIDAQLSDVMYVGDSITDVEAFKVVRANGGLTVSFNGNNYAVKSAEVAVLSESNLVTAAVADLFCRFGKEKTLSVLQTWNYEALRKTGVANVLITQLKDFYSEALPKAQIVTPQNIETLAKESSEFRKKVRGVAIGRLG